MKIGYFLLKRFPQKAIHAPLLPLSRVKNIAVLYDTAKLSSKGILQVVRYLEERGKTVHTLGFSDTKELGKEYVPNYKHMFFCREQLSFWRLPNPNTLRNFLESPFDYLINLDINGELPLQSVSVYASAKTRIGKYFEPFEFSQDFMIKTDADSVLTLFEQLIQYIKK